MEKRNLLFPCVLLVSFAASVWAADELAQRQMGVRQGPDSVFDRPVEEILPALVDAKPTGRNGRVGNELVFWGYELADGRHVEFFGCALRANVDCEQRVQMICPSQMTVIEKRETTGKVAHRTCRPYVVTGTVGNAPPGCNESENDAADLLVGLVQCGG